MPPAKNLHPCLGCDNSFEKEASLQRHYALRISCNRHYEQYLRRVGETAHLPAVTAGAANHQFRPTHPRPSQTSSTPSSAHDIPPHNDGNAAPGGTLANEPLDAQGDRLMAEAGVPGENVPSDHPPTLPNIRSASQETHGYATVETHPNAARVFGWRDPRPPNVSNNWLDRSDLFELGEWLCELPISNGDRARYFEIERHKQDLPWENLTEFYRSVDALPHGPDWSYKQLRVSTPEGEEVLDLWKRCPVSGTEFLISESRFKGRIHFAPEKNFRIKPDGRRVRVRSHMRTAEWWWRMQDTLGGDATIAPIILATDATQLALFGHKKAWPVYMTIGNLDNEVRRRPSERGMILIGYIPVPDLSFISNEEERRQKHWEVYHASMGEILASLKQASSCGVEMVCADGAVRRVHPIVAAHMADFEEQCTASCTMKTRCPVCDVPLKGRGNGQGDAKIRTRMETVKALRHQQQGYSLTRHNLGLRPVWPYWANLPFATGHTSFVPDLLHQVHRGMFKDHLLTRWIHILGEKTIDERLMGMPRFPGIRHFKTGISSFINSQWTGMESKAVAKVFLPMVAGSRPPEAVGAARCIMDFMYRARLPQLDDDDLEELEVDLAKFHQLKDIFVSKGGLNTALGWDGIPKLHMLSHYVYFIREFGTTDGYNTEISERLHIDYVKIPYRASSKVDPILQMITWLQRREAWLLQRRKLEEAGAIAERHNKRPGEEEFETDSQDTKSAEVVEDDEDDEGVDDAESTPLATKHEQGHGQSEYHPAPTIYHAKKPTKPSVSGRDIAVRHDAPGFMDAVKHYVSQLPGGKEHARLLSENFRFGVWTKVSLIHDPLPFAPLVGGKTDTVRARPAEVRQGLARPRPRAFDTVLVEADQSVRGTRRYRAARVRVIFKLPTFCHELTSEPLAYVELFTAFTSPSISPHGLFQTSHQLHSGNRVTTVIPVSKIRMACHLSPRYTSFDLPFLISSNTDLLSVCSQFFLNRHSSYYFFSLSDYWRSMAQR
ncbi:hypothetical protein FS749_015043 [Ceratobasidium sp. UAMH 11750]|nr:hypothetical protein FS749_015043 [Ceratobasidium sp. UAMH 11750]